MTTEGRWRQFKMMLSDEEWYRLDVCAGADEVSMAELLRAFIERRYAEVTRSPEADLHAIADDLVDRAKRLRGVARRRERSRS